MTTTENQNWIETTIKSWARRWYWLLGVAFLIGISIWLNHNTDRTASIVVLFLTPFFVAMSAAVHCLSSEILNLRKRIEDLENK